MAERIYVVDPVTNKVECVESVSFGSLSVTERQGLQEWVLQNPEVLGEKLLVITSEFARFDRSDRRLDVLALDTDCRLVIVELKLDASGSLADLQAIRYAAFCSTMEMADVVEEMCGREGLREEEAEMKLLEFLQVDELPPLGDEPRIILAAGSMDDQELTSCVLWLRRFGVDITCVEVTPYKPPDTERITLVPRVIIPLPEARDYVVKVERKEAIQRTDQVTHRSDQALWDAVARAFNACALPFQSRAKRPGKYSQIRFGDPRVHYEWQILKRRGALEVALHFEHNQPDDNYRLLDIISHATACIAEAVPWEFRAEKWGQRWARVQFLIPYDGGAPAAEIAPAAAEAMKTLIQRTWPLIRHHVEARDEFMSFPENT